MLLGVAVKLTFIINFNNFQEKFQKRNKNIPEEHEAPLTLGTFQPYATYYGWETRTEESATSNSFDL